MVFVLLVEVELDIRLVSGGEIEMKWVCFGWKEDQTRQF